MGRLSSHRLRLARTLAAVALLGAGAGMASAEAPATGATSELERALVAQAGGLCPAADRYSLERPDAAAGPTVVGMAVFFQDIAQLSDVEQTLDADVYVVVRWRDPRLADASRGAGAADCPLPEGRLWMPALEPENLRGRQAFYPARFLVDEHGLVTLVRRLWVKLAQPLDFRDFPFDRHQWVVTIWPVLSRSDDVVFHALERLTGKSERLSLQGWRVGTPRATASVGPRAPRIGRFARLDVELELVREWTYHAWKLGLPLTLIVLMAYGVYLIPPTAAPQQIALGMTSMLTLIAYMLALGGTLPRIAYLTRADRFFVGSALLVFLGLVKALAGLALQQRPELAERMNRLGRWLYPLGMLANAGLALLY
jgi:hypothetical protein